MRIIDAHIHFSNIESFRETARSISFLDYSSDGLIKEFREAGIVAAVGMGLTEQEAWGFPDHASPNPMLLDLESAVPGLVALCPGINPVLLERGGKDELERTEALLSRPDVVGIKLYAGYYPYYVSDAVYEPVYRLAERYGLAVVIHGGATYSDRCMLKYSHPLVVDEVAVRHRSLNFVIAHLGDPWVMDTAVVVSKNDNVFSDLSGLIVADGPKIREIRSDRLAMDHLMRALVYTDKYHKFIFGSDWPLAPVQPYIEFVKDMIPEKHTDSVFYQNALKVFPKLENFIRSNKL